MALVIDASVAIKWLVREKLNDEARRLLTIPDPLICAGLDRHGGS